MNTNTSLIIGSVTQSGDKNQKTIIEANGKVDGVILREFGEQLNDLTTNTFGEAVRVDKAGLDDSDGTKTTPTLTATPATIQTGHATNYTVPPYCPEATVVYTGDGELSVNSGSVKSRLDKSGSDWKLRIYEPRGSIGNVTISAAETDLFTAASTVVTITN